MSNALNATLRWFFVFLVGFGLTWGALYWRRLSVQGSPPPDEFLANYGLFAAISTVFAALMLALLFFEANRTSHIPPPRPTLLTAGIAWFLLAGLAVFDVPRGIAYQMFQWDELLNHLCGILGCIGVSGVVLALRLPEFSGNAPLGKAHRRDHSAR